MNINDTLVDVRLGYIKPGDRATINSKIYTIKDTWKTRPEWQFGWVTATRDNGKIEISAELNEITSWVYKDGKPL